ncbi:MAG: hypothetical protein ACYDIE_12540 [Candidatus Krumholzibacteriia bacterium]
MQRKFLPVVLCAASLLLLPAPGARAQTAPPAASATEVPEAIYRLKKVSLSLYAGTFSGGTFFELPAPGDRTQVDEGSDVVYRYDGLPFTTLDRRYYFAPRKRIESSTQLGGSIGFYLSDQFHLDLQLAMAASKATTSFLYVDPHATVPDTVRVQVDEDPGFKALMGGAGLAVDATSLSFAGITPYAGCSFGGILNRFTQLEDKTALYFQVQLGLYHDFGSKFRLSTQFAATTFSFAREELTYGQRVTYTNLSVGVAYLVDMVPGD